MARRAIYKAYKNGELIAEGNAWEVSKALGISITTMRNYISSPKTTKIYRFERVN